MANIKETDYYSNLYVLNSIEMEIEGNTYETDIWSDDLIVKMNGKQILEENPIQMYKEAETLISLANIDIPESTKIKRKISESADDWYVELMLYKNEDKVPMIRRSYHQKNREDWTETEVMHMSFIAMYNLFMAIKNEIETADVDF